MTNPDARALCILDTQQFAELCSELARKGYETFLTKKLRSGLIRDTQKNIVLRATSVSLHEFWIVHADAGLIPDCYIDVHKRPQILLQGAAGSREALTQLAHQLSWLLGMDTTATMVELSAGTYEHFVGSFMLKFGHIVELKQPLNS